MRAITPKVDSPGPGDQQALADDWNQFGDELEELIQSSGQTLAAGTLDQLSKAVSSYAAVADFYTENGGSTGAAYILDGIDFFHEPVAYKAGLRVRLRPLTASTSTTPTLAISGLSAHTITNEDNSALSVGAITTSQDHTFRFDVATNQWKHILPTAGLAWPKGFIDGCVTEQSAAYTFDGIDFLAGSYRDADDTNNFVFTSTITKRAATAWSTGLGGTPAALLPSGVLDEVLYMFLLGRDSDGSVQAGFDTDIDAANLLADGNVIAWDPSPKYRMVCAVWFIDSGGGEWEDYWQDPYDPSYVFWRNGGVGGINITYPNTSGVQPHVFAEVPPWARMDYVASITKDASATSTNVPRLSFVPAPLDVSYFAATPNLSIGFTDLCLPGDGADVGLSHSRLATRIGSGSELGMAVAIVTDFAQFNVIIHPVGYWLER